MKKRLVVLTSLLVCGVQGMEHRVELQPQEKSTRWQKVKNAGSSLKTRFSMDTIRRNLETSSDRRSREDSNFIRDNNPRLKPGQKMGNITYLDKPVSTAKMAVKSFKENLYTRPKNWIEGRIKAKQNLSNFSEKRFNSDEILPEGSNSSLNSKNNALSAKYQETGKPVTAYSESDRQVDSQKAIEFGFNQIKESQKQIRILKEKEAKDSLSEEQKFSLRWYKQKMADDIENYRKDLTDAQVKELEIA